MNIVRGVFLAAIGVWASSAISAAQAGCRAITVRDRVEAPAGVVSLADLFAPGACEVLRFSAARVSLGQSPRLGSPRVLAGEAVEALLERLEREQGLNGIHAHIPARVIIRSQAAQSTCVDLAGQLGLASAESMSQSDDRLRSRSTTTGLTCGEANLVRDGTAIRVAGTKWNPALASWDFSVACVPRTECVPFLLRVPERMFPNAEPALHANQFGAPWRSVQPTRAAFEISTTKAIAVRRGEKVLLEWDAPGIRVRVPAVSLDAGVVGGQVRARLEPSGRVLYATVIEPGELRAGS